MPGSFSFRKIQKGKGEVTAKLVGGVQFLLKKCGVTVINGEASLEKNRVVRCGGPGVQGENVVIATGSVPMTVPIPGHELTIDSTGALNLERLPRPYGGDGRRCHRVGTGQRLCLLRH